MEPENETGNVEYKLKLTCTDNERIENLATQMRYRCAQGDGECIYNLGIEDDGTMIGITGIEYEETIKIINLIAGKNNYSVKILSVIPVKDGKNIFLAVFNLF